VSRQAAKTTLFAEPAIREIDGRLHQRLADAFALPVVVHGHADLPDVPAPRHRRLRDADDADHFLFDAGEQGAMAVLRVCHPFPPGPATFSTLLSFCPESALVAGLRSAAA
jgi:hypothetical protein